MASVREHPAVGENTTMHLPGTWSHAERYIEEPDTFDAGYLLGLHSGFRGDDNIELTSTAGGKGEGGDGAVPGVGVPAVLAVLGALAAALVAHRSNRR